MKTESMVTRSMSVVLFSVAIVCAAAAAEPRPAAGTAPEPQEADGVDLDQLLALADASARRYAEVIQNLTTEETTTILAYDDEGRVTERRVFVSQLMVHRFTHSPSPGRMEYRHVLSVDGREAGDRELRVQVLATDLANASSLGEEAEIIVRESRKFGLELRGWSSTVAHWWVESIYRNREGFELAVAGRETIDGMDFILVDFREIQARPGTPRGMPDTAEYHARGRLWLEASTGDLWREKGGWFVEGLPGLSEDPVTVPYDYQYARSSHGIFTPERFESAPQARVRALLRGDSSPAERTIHDFAPFERFDTDVQFFVDETVR